jgi:hypothetical protein
MTSVNWLIPMIMGSTFTLIGVAKIYGLTRHIVGGADKPFVTQLCGI